MGRRGAITPTNHDIQGLCKLTLYVIEKEAMLLNITKLKAN